MKGDADRLLESAKEKVPGQTMSAEKLAKAQAILANEENDVQAAAKFCEEIIAWLNEEWNERGFTPEQRIFSIALATVNLRQHFPENRGGKEFFDSVSKKAWTYYAEASKDG